MGFLALVELVREGPPYGRDGQHTGTYAGGGGAGGLGENEFETLDANVVPLACEGMGGLADTVNGISGDLADGRVARSANDDASSVRDVAGNCSAQAGQGCLHDGK